MSIKKETLVTICLSVVLVGLSILLFVVATPIFFPDDDVSQEESAQTTEIPQAVQNSELYEGVSDELAMEIEESRDTFYRERNYQAAIDSIKEQTENTDLSSEEEGRLLLSLAQRKIRNEAREAAQLLISIYSNENYTDQVRAEALETINWHIGGNLNHFSSEWEQVELQSKHGQTAREFFIEIYGPEGLNITNSDQLVDLNDGRRVIILAFERVLDIDPDRFLSRVMMANQYAKLATFADDPEEAAELAQIARIETDFAGEDAARYEEYSLRNDRYDNYVAAYKSYSLRISYYLYFAGQEDINILTDKLQELFPYTDRFNDDTYVANLFNAVAVEQYVIALAHANDNDLNQEQQQYVRELVMNRYLSLPDEDYERRLYPRYLGSAELDQLRSEQRASYQYIAKDVVPALQPTLIDKIGGWSEEDFE